MRRFLSLALVLVLCLSMAACGKKTEDSLSDGVLTVALDITVTPELKLEGVARDLVRSIQNLRKTEDFQITDRIRVTLPDTAENRDCVETFRDYISAQVLADDIDFGTELKATRV